MSEQTSASWMMRPMDVDEVGRICEIDVSETGEVVYKWVDGQVEPIPEHWQRRPYDAAGWRQRADMVKAALATGGAALGAFNGPVLVGFAAVRYRLAEDVAQLVALWVRAAYRRRGIAAALTGEAARLAGDSGAATLYVSATPSESAQAFYRSRGFRPTQFVHMELFEQEPEDIHMVKQL